MEGHSPGQAEGHREDVEGRSIRAEAILCWMIGIPLWLPNATPTQIRIGYDPAKVT
jgi:hypothetical protein